jgi:hypothetical protein
MPSEAKAVFDRNITRATYFLDIHEKAQEGAGAPTLASRELPRGAVVFAIGALDAYISQLMAEVIVAQVQTGQPVFEQRDVLKRIQADLPTLALEVALIPDSADRLERVRGAIVGHFQDNVSNLGSKAVSAAVLRMGKRPAQLWDSISESYPRAADELDNWTEVRHKIVHRGQKPRVWRPQARDLIQLIQAIANRLDELAFQAQD